MFLVTDSSANGTMVGNQRVRQTTVQVGANVPMRVGPYIVRPIATLTPGVGQFGAPQPPQQQSYPQQQTAGYPQQQTAGYPQQQTAGFPPQQQQQ